MTNPQSCSTMYLHSKWTFVSEQTAGNHGTQSVGAIGWGWIKDKYYSFYHRPPSQAGRTAKGNIPSGGFFVSFFRIKTQPENRKVLKHMSNNFQILHATELIRENEFEEALKILVEQSYSPKTPAEISFLALAEAATKHTYKSSVDKCIHALEKWPTNVDIYLNLSTILYLAGRRDLATLKLLRGLTYHPEHKGLKKLHKRLGIRRQPALPFLSRNNSVNIIAGKIISKTGGGLAA